MGQDRGVSFLQESPADERRRAGLRRMRTVATGLLVLAAVIYILTHGHGGAWGYVNAAAEAAMVGAEMYFPMHPGAAADDESLFPSMSTPAPARPTERVAKTVWGTPAASQTHSAAAPDTQHMDEAWHTLEERSGNPEQSEGKRPGPKTKRKPKLILTGGGRAAW